MDAFYASVEQRDHPELRGKPVIVGAPPSQRGVVCAASYEARKFGVRSALPSATAGRLCPSGIFVRPRMDRYKEESREIMKIVAATGAVVEQMSIDEAYVDFSAICQADDADGSLLLSVPLAQKLKERIVTERKLTATIGIAANKLLSKIASDHQKPDGLTVISEKEKAHFLRPLPVRASSALEKSPSRCSTRLESGRLPTCRITQVICARLSAPSGQSCASSHAAKMIVRCIWVTKSKASAAKRHFLPTPTTENCSAPACAPRLRTFRVD